MDGGPASRMGDRILVSVQRALAAAGVRGTTLLRRFRVVEEQAAASSRMTCEGQRDVVGYGDFVDAMSVVRLSASDLRSLFVAYDKQGLFSFRRFVDDVTGDLSPRRRALVESTFRRISRGCDKIDISDVVNSYRGDQQDLLQSLKDCDLLVDGHSLTRSGLVEYYRLASALDADNDFDAAIEAVWWVPPRRKQSLATAADAKGATISSLATMSTEEDNEAGDATTRVRRSLATLGVHAYHELRAAFRAVDTNEDGLVSLSEFVEALRKVGAYHGRRDAEALYADDFGNFLRLLAAPLSPRRAEVVADIFRQISQGAPRVSPGVVARKFDASALRRHTLGATTTTDEIYAKFMEHFDVGLDGLVSLDEFESYHALLSANEPDDARFEAMARNAWPLDEASPTSKKLSVAKCVAEELRKRGQQGFVDYRRSLQAAADDSGALTLEAFTAAASSVPGGLPVAEADLATLYESSVDACIDAVRPAMSERRAALVDLAFNRVDDGSGSVSPSALASRFDAARAPDVVAGRTDKKAAFDKFLRAFDVQGDGGRVSRRDFFDFHADFSAVTEFDDEFDRFVRNVWRLSPLDVHDEDSQAEQITVVAHRVDGRRTVERLPANVRDTVDVHDPDSLVRALREHCNVAASSAFAVKSTSCRDEHRPHRRKIVGGFASQATGGEALPGKSSPCVNFFGIRDMICISGNEGGRDDPRQVRIGCPNQALPPSPPEFVRSSQRAAAWRCWKESSGRRRRLTISRIRHVRFYDSVLTYFLYFCLLSRSDEEKIAVGFPTRKTLGQT